MIRNMDLKKKTDQDQNKEMEAMISDMDGLADKMKAEN